jgi:hypothetical protein
MYIISLSDVSLCNCVAPPFGFWYIHIDLSIKKKKKIGKHSAKALAYDNEPYLDGSDVNGRPVKPRLY